MKNLTRFIAFVGFFLSILYSPVAVFGQSSASDEVTGLEQLRVIAPLSSSDQTLKVISVPEEVANFGDATQGEGRYYLLEATNGSSGIIKSTTELLKISRIPIERLFWYSSIPVLTATKLFPYFIAGANPWVVLPVAAFILVKAPVITVAKSMVGLQIRARYRAKRQALAMQKQIPNIDKIFFMQVFQARMGHVVTDDVTASTLFLIKTNGPVTNDVIKIPNVDGDGEKLKTQEFKLVEKDNFQNTRFEFRLGSQTLDTSSIPPFEVSFDELVQGIRLPEEIREKWYAPMRTDWKQNFKHLFSKHESGSENSFFVELKLKTKNEEVVLGNYTSGHGMKAFLGETFFRKIWSRLRYFFNLSATPIESAKLKIQGPSERFGLACKELF